MCTSVCRICLVDNVKMFYVLHYPYLDVYKKFTSAELNSVDRPRGVCYICLALLQRCCRFSDMARRSEQILTDMFNSGIEVTQQNILTFVSGVKDNNIIDLAIGPTHLTTLDGWDTVETCVTVNIKQEPLTVKEENISPFDIVLKEESTDCENITNIKSESANDIVISRTTVYNVPNDVTLNNTSSKDKQYGEESAIHKNIDDNVSIFQRSFMKEMDIKQTKVNLYPCKHCTATFTKKMFLIAHIKLTHQKDNYKLRRNNSQKTVSFEKIPITEMMCHGKQCSKNFSENIKLVGDIKKHTGGRKFICEICGKRIAALGDLRVHIRTHTGEKPYSCEHCHKKFKTKHEVVLHIRTHTGEKPHTCTQCGKSFSQAGYLGIHKRSHTGEKPYACLQCDFRFSSKSDLVKHVQTHTSREKRYFCQQCDKGFYTNHHLKRHNRIHTGEKPYACEMCPKSFTQRSDLVIHVRTHTGEKPYSCTQCDQTFPTSSSLVKHKRTHTGEKM